ncbi:nuclear transport factor 2 family protein [Marinobacterium aestuariivivens]|uniref:Nuclear transport factor 2 family protein n=1 Tax=Marinobacterium aestuariivivens TaxID=1698799 RepID=A0ABW2A3N9_9GAMM
MSDLTALDARLRALEDLEQIRTLKYHYWRSVDARDFEAVEACFATGALVIDYELFGSFERREDMVEAIRNAGLGAEVQDFHHGQNPEIRLTGPDSAAGLWDIYYFMLDPASGTTLQLSGAYEDEYVRQDGEWKVCKSRFVVTSRLSGQISEDGQYRVAALGR